jgi:hypothetical protein
MHDGHVAGVVDAAGADRMALGRLMLSGSPAQAAQDTPQEVAS